MNQGNTYSFNTATDIVNNVPDVTKKSPGKIIRLIKKVVAPDTTASWVIVIVCILLLLGGMGTGIYFLARYIKNKKNDTEEKSPSRPPPPPSSIPQAVTPPIIPAPIKPISTPAPIGPILAPPILPSVAPMNVQNTPMFSTPVTPRPVKPTSVTTPRPVKPTPVTTPHPVKPTLVTTPRPAPKTNVKKPKKTKKTKKIKTTTSSSDGWKSAYATYYNSYPECCKESPSYKASANKSECSDYSGCKYMGQFSGISGKLSYEEVQKKNIVSFYDAANQKSGDCAKQNKECKWWNTNVKGKKIIVKNPTTGQEMTVEPLDTCNDADTDNKDCTKNAGQGGGTLIDFEIFTAKRFWGGKAKNGKIQWKFV